MISDKPLPRYRGDAMQVVRMSQARGKNNGLGYSLSYVSKVLRKERRCADITEMHRELVALRTPKASKKA